MIGREKKTGTWRPGQAGLCERSETCNTNHVLGTFQAHLEKIFINIWTNIQSELETILIPCWMSTSMGGVGVLDVAWRPEKLDINLILFKSHILSS